MITAIAQNNGAAKAYTSDLMLVRHMRLLPMETATGFTIDGASSQDLDDAVWVATDGNNAQLQVHITDVASQVPPDSFLDRQARKRGETAYLLTTRKPLFPHSLEDIQNGLVVEQPLTIANPFK